MTSGLIHSPKDVEERAAEDVGLRFANLASGLGSGLSFQLDESGAGAGNDKDRQGRNSNIQSVPFHSLE